MYYVGVEEKLVQPLWMRLLTSFGWLLYYGSSAGAFFSIYLTTGIAGWAYGGFAGVFLLNIFVHEGGHTFEAVRRGFRLHEVQVGPIALSFNSARGWRLGFRSTWLAGHIMATPNKLQNAAEDSYRVTLGGPLATAGFAGIGLIVASAAALGGLVELSLYSLCVFGLAAGAIILSLMPNGCNDHPNDAQIMSMERSEYGEHYVAYRALATCIHTGELDDPRIEQWLPIVRRIPLGHPLWGDAQYALAWLSHTRHEDEFSETLFLLLKHRDQLPERYRGWILISSAQYTAMLKGDAAEAESLLKEAGTAAVDYEVAYDLAQAAIAQAKGEHEKAAEHAAKALPHLESDKEHPEYKWALSLVEKAS